MSIETKRNQRLTRAEVCNLIVSELAYSPATASSRTIYENDFASARTNNRFFDADKVINAINKRLGYVRST